MFLFVNPPGTRHVLCETFNDVTKLIKNAPEDGEYQFTVLVPGNTGTYDLIVSRVSEPVSKNQYIKARFVKNPENGGECVKSADPLASLVYPLFSSYTEVGETGPSFDALSLIVDSFLVNGFLSVDKSIPDSILDDFEKLTACLDDFFKS